MKFYVVINEDETYEGAPCYSLEEAEELALYHENSRIYEVTSDCEVLD